ncbi:tyrosine-type recombinase/integrase [Williamsia muralis]|uniref:Tyrosine-type recombinase/integrase n=1 Tax=Williamsia marianensis TaxID=85044 RepID=A0ABU4EVT8_WILMA|nr:tyrosine-type recombinase/integrase [Williamsia muralis]MDV7135373.1 tyrosine-type recombinase/integrase [Williamsia muralis]
MASKRSFGGLRQLPSRRDTKSRKFGRWQANYTGPDGIVHKAPHTFTAKIDAEGWLAAERRKIELGSWRPPTTEAARGVIVRDYGAQWLSQRDLKPRTRSLYADLLRLHIAPVLGDTEIGALTPAVVRAWHAELATGPTRKSHAYQLLHAIMRTAVIDELIDANPCRIEGAMHVKRSREPVVLDAAELAALAAAMPEQWRTSVLLMGWCGLRRGELFELRRGDVNLRAGTISISRAVAYRDGEFRVDTPKTTAGVRTVVVPPHIRTTLKAHMTANVARGNNSLLFAGVTGGHVGEWDYRKVFRPAAASIGKPELRVHDLRHAGAVLAAQSGATVAELMHRIGHTTPTMAMKYQHVAVNRDAEIAARMSRLATGE